MTEEELREEIAQAIEQAHKDFKCSALVGPLCSCALSIKIARGIK
jgi:hypothetical protein